MPTRRGSEGSAPSRRLVACTLALAAAALAGCGGGGDDAPAHARSPCSRAIADVLGAHASARLAARAPDVVTCEYRAGAPARVRLRVAVDTAPQAAARFSRAVVERAQAHLGGAHDQLPQQMNGIGQGADWVPAARELLATDGRRLVTVTVLGGARATNAAARRTAVAAARAALRPAAG